MLARVILSILLLAPLTGMATTTPIGPGAPTVAFDAFQADYEPPAQTSARYYQMRIGWAESKTPVPETDTNGFAVFHDRPPAHLAERVKLTSLETRLHDRTQHKDYTPIKKTPDGKAFEGNAITGTFVYCLPTDERGGTVNASIYYHYAEVDSWRKLFGEYMNPVLAQKTFMAELSLPTDAWVVIRGEPREVMVDAQRDKREVYHSYFLIRISRG